MNTAHEIAWPIFKEHNETKSENEEQSEPKQSTQKRHGKGYLLAIQRSTTADGASILNVMPKLPSYLAMRVPLTDLGEQYRTLSAPIRNAIDEVLGSQRFILGSKVQALEEAICAYCDVPHAIGVSSGTDALLAILMALGIGRGDAIITTPYTFFASAGCVARVGARPLFADIDPRTFNISPSAIERCLKENCQRDSQGGWRTKTGEKIRALIAVHLFGSCCDMEALREISQRFQLVLIEDAAQAIGAEFPAAERTEKAGSMGDVALFSFYPSKNLGAAGDAGMILCRDETLASRLRTIRNHGMEPRYFHHVVGGNFRLDEIQAAILTVKLPSLEKWAAARRAVADFYRAEFAKAGLIEGIELPGEPHRKRGVINYHVYHQYVIRTQQRDALRDHLSKREIDTAIYYPLGLHEQECFAYLGYKKGDFPETERAAGEALALPMYPEISRQAQRHVVKGIVEFFE